VIDLLGINQSINQSIIVKHWIYSKRRGEASQHDCGQLLAARAILMIGIKSNQIKSNQLDGLNEKEIFSNIWSEGGSIQLVGQLDNLQFAEAVNSSI
jgi:hypothetical protein